MFKNVFVYGDSLQDYIVAVVVLEEDEVRKWTEKEEIEFDNYSEFIQSDVMKNKVLDLFKDFRVTANLNSLEIPKKVHICEQEFTVESGLLTPTFKLKRTEAKQMFIKEIKDMYEGAAFQGEI